MTEEARELDHYTHPHQVEVPWGKQTASFQTGAQSCERIVARPSGVEVQVKQGEKRWLLLFTVSGGYGYAEIREKAKGK